VVLFVRGTLIGADRSLRCALVNLSAGGALLTMTGNLPIAPLRLVFELEDERLEFPVEVARACPEGVAVAFPRPHSERLHRLLAGAQRRALAQGRVNISERRVPGAWRAVRLEPPGRPRIVHGDERRSPERPGSEAG
jgi:hypothetical protein